MSYEDRIRIHQEKTHKEDALRSEMLLPAGERRAVLEWAKEILKKSKTELEQNGNPGYGDIAIVFEAQVLARIGEDIHRGEFTNYQAALQQKQTKFGEMHRTVGEEHMLAAVLKDVFENNDYNEEYNGLVYLLGRDNMYDKGKYNCDSSSKAITAILEGVAEGAYANRLFIQSYTNHRRALLWQDNGSYLVLEKGGPQVLPDDEVEGTAIVSLLDTKRLTLGLPVIEDIPEITRKFPEDREYKKSRKIAADDYSLSIIKDTVKPQKKPSKQSRTNFSQQLHQRVTGAVTYFNGGISKHRRKILTTVTLGMIYAGVESVTKFVDDTVQDTTNTTGELVHQGWKMVTEKATAIATDLESALHEMRSKPTELPYSSTIPTELGQSNVELVSPQDIEQAEQFANESFGVERAMNLSDYITSVDNLAAWQAAKNVHDSKELSALPTPQFNITLPAEVKRITSDGWARLLTEHAIDAQLDKKYPQVFTIIDDSGKPFEKNHIALNFIATQEIDTSQMQSDIDRILGRHIIRQDDMLTWSLNDIYTIKINGVDVYQRSNGFFDQVYLAAKKEADALHLNSNQLTDEQIDAIIIGVKNQPETHY